MTRVAWLFVLWGCGHKDEDPLVPEPTGPPAPNDRFIDCTSERLDTWEELGATPKPVDLGVTTTYDGYGWMVDVLQEPSAPAPGAALHASWSRRLDGQYTSYQYDAESDGTLDSSEKLTYDDDDLPSTWEIDYDGDGIVDDLRTFTAEDGVLVTQEQDLGLDGTIDLVLTYYHDDLDRRTGIDADNGVDGTLDWTARWEYRGSSEDVMRYEENVGADNFIDYVEEHTYDNSGRETSFLAVALGMGGQSDEYTYTYSGGDREPSSAEWRTFLGYETAQIVTMSMSYDDARRITLRESLYSPGDAPVDLSLTEETTWSCGE